MAKVRNTFSTGIRIKANTLMGFLKALGSTFGTTEADTRVSLNKDSEVERDTGSPQIQGRNIREDT